MRREDGIGLRARERRVQGEGGPRVQPLRPAVSLTRRRIRNGSGPGPPRRPRREAGEPDAGTPHVRF